MRNAARQGPLWTAGFFVSVALGGATNPPPVTFSKDILPILQKSCQACHRPGEAAPFPLLTYQQARPWAKAIREAVLLRKMPPWFADPHYGKFSNDRSLSQQDIQTLVAWVESGALQGDPNDAPPPVSFVEGWTIPKPDLVIELPKPVHVPPSGTVEYQHVVVPAGMTEDRWIQYAEARPGNPALVHHIVVFIREPGSKWLKDAKPGVPFVPSAANRKKDDDGIPGEVLAGYAPGLPATQLQPGQAILLKAGSDIVFQLHYTTNGKAGTDLSRVGLVYATTPPRQRVSSLSAYNNQFTVPVGDANYRVDSDFEMGAPAELISMQPHMHSRGKDFEFRAVYPSGRIETLLRVPKYSFSWQLAYYPAKPIPLPKGTIIECTAHFDNSRNNPDNPDASKAVSWGDQSWNEMMIGFFSVAYDPAIPPRKLFPEPKKQENRPQAKSPEELTALREFLATTTPGQQIRAINNVLTKFPNTSFKVILLETAIRIEQSGGNLEGVQSYGERLLRVDPRNAFALVTMASEIAGHIREADQDKEAQLAKADRYTKAGLEAAKIMPRPRADMSDARWEAGKKILQAQAYETLALVARWRKQSDPEIWIGLGKVYIDSGKLDEAAVAFDKALAAPGISPQAKSAAETGKAEVARRRGAHETN